MDSPPEDDKVMKSDAEAPGEVEPTSFLTLTEATFLYAYVLTQAKEERTKDQPSDRGGE